MLGNSVWWWVVLAALAAAVLALDLYDLDRRRRRRALVSLTRFWFVVGVFMVEGLLEAAEGVWTGRVFAAGAVLGILFCMLDDVVRSWTERCGGGG